MKLVTAIIQPHALTPVTEALRDIAVTGMTVTEVAGSGRQGGHTEVYRGAEYRIDTIPKLKVDIVCTDESVEDIVSVIVTAAHSGKIGDGKVWVTPVETLVRVRTGERGTDAI